MSGFARAARRRAARALVARKRRVYTRNSAAVHAAIERAVAAGEEFRPCGCIGIELTCPKCKEET